MLVTAGVLVLGIGCGAGSSTGPAWPKSTVKEPDGGETLAPRPSAASVAAVERAPEPAEKIEARAAFESATKPDATSETKPAVAKPAPGSDKTDDPITTEEIVIEINDD